MFLGADVWLGPSEALDRCLRARLGLLRLRDELRRSDPRIGDEGRGLAGALRFRRGSGRLLVGVTTGGLVLGLSAVSIPAISTVGAIGADSEGRGPGPLPLL